MDLDEFMSTREPDMTRFSMLHALHDPMLGLRDPVPSQESNHDMFDFLAVMTLWNWFTK